VERLDPPVIGERELASGFLQRKVYMLRKRHPIVSAISSSLLGFVCVFAPLFAESESQPAAIASTKIQALTNADVIVMVKAGLSDEVTLEKIRRSPVAFDVSTEALVSLNTAGVSDQVVKALLARPKGPPALDPRPDIGQAQTTNPVVTSMGHIATVLVKAPTEVLRTNAEKVIAQLGGPRVNSSEVGYDAVLVIGVDCGKQRWSFWTGAHFTTCEGSMTIESGGQRLWSTTDEERAANEAKAGRKMAERMTAEFVQVWQAARSN
jgi:hypothetical protein